MADVAHLHPVFRARIEALCQATGCFVNSAYRSSQRQAELYQDFLNHRGNPANPPGSSNHEAIPNGSPAGLAVDLGGNLGAARARMDEFGVCFPIPSEDWHVQPAECPQPQYEAGSELRLGPRPPDDPFQIGDRSVLVLDKSLDAYTIETFCAKALDVPGGSVVDGTPIQQFAGNGGACQLWYFDACGADQWRIISKSSGRVLDIAGGGPAGTPVIQWPWNGSPNQRWGLEQVRPGRGLIFSVGRPELTLNISGGCEDNGSPVIVWGRADNCENQVFRVYTRKDDNIVDLISS
jgi:hypothetical protein